MERATESRLYDTDFAEWTTEQAAALRDGRYSRLDLENLADEIESLGKRDKREFFSHMVRLYVHVLKFQYQPERATQSSLRTIVDASREAKDSLEDSPSLTRKLREDEARLYLRARREASIDTRLPLNTFPEEPSNAFIDVIASAYNEDFGWAVAIVDENNQSRIQRFRRRN